MFAIGEAQRYETAETPEKREENQTANQQVGGRTLRKLHERVRQIRQYEGEREAGGVPVPRAGVKGEQEYDSERDRSTVRQHCPPRGYGKLLPA